MAPVRERSVHSGGYEQFPARDGVGQFQAFGAEELVGDPKGLRIGDALFASVLGISQDGKAHMGAVDSQLVGPAGDGTQFKFT